MRSNTFSGFEEKVFKGKDYKPTKHELNITELNSTEDKQQSLFGKSFSYGKEVLSFGPVETNVFDVAAYILKSQGEMTTMKLHKLLYYCQAWSLVWDEDPIFNEEIQAWANGPVVPKLFAYHRGYYKIELIQIGRANVLNEDQQETVNSVLDYYGNKSSQWLIELTHLENPWKDARNGLYPDDKSVKVISLTSMADYYSSL